MPEITFRWHRQSDAKRVVGMVYALYAIADAHDVSFSANAKGQAEGESTVPDDVELPADLPERLREMAERTGVTIQVRRA